MFSSRVHLFLLLTTGSSGNCVKPPYGDAPSWVQELLTCNLDIRLTSISTSAVCLLLEFSHCQAHPYSVRSSNPIDCCKHSTYGLAGWDFAIIPQLEIEVT